MKIFAYFRVLLHLIREYNIQQKLNKEFLIPKISSLEYKFEGHFTPEQIFKIKKYYALYIPTLINSNLKKIYSQKLSEKERKLATLFGILTPLYDDIFDLELLSDAEYRQITLYPNEYEANRFQSKVVKSLQSELINTVRNPENYLTACEKVLNAQINSKLQTKKSLSKNELEKITYEKGGHSMILYHHLIDQDMTILVQDLLYTIGSAYQLSNDIFDLYKDVRDGIYTLANTCTDFVELKKTYSTHIALQNTKLRKLNLDRKTTFHLVFSFNLVHSRTLVALDHMAKSFPKLPSDPFEYWKLKERKALIVDMENPINILKWVWYTYKVVEY